MAHPHHRRHSQQWHATSSEDAPSFGAWLRQRRRALDLTQEALAQRVGCARITIRRIEADELKPSQQLAELFAEHLGVPLAERKHWLQFARGLAPFPQAQVSDLPVMTPALPVGPPTNLPAPLTSFLGRDHELIDGCRLVATGRLLTLTGVGGAGKTRLAQEIARSILDLGNTHNPKPQIEPLKFPDGIWWVELAPLTNPALIPETVAKVLGLREQPGQAIERLLAEALKTRQMLLLLDNCEHLVAACAQWIQQWLHDSPHLHILTTSREPLQLLGEQRFPVAPLAADSASELFVQRARLVDPTFTDIAANGAAIEQLCQQVDYLPLAIELLAARSDLFSPQAMLERLQARPLDLLSAEMRNLPTRQRTLRHTIQHSYDLLTEREQALFRTLGVFVGGFDLAAVTFLGFREEVLQSLSNKSLVQRGMYQEQGARYFLLETLRSYAMELLDSEQERQTAQQRHTQYFLELAENAYRHLGHDVESAYYDQLEREHDNLRAALQWWLTTNPASALQMAGALREFWCIRGHYSEGRQWVAQALAKSPALPSLARSRALHAAGKIALRQADFRQASPLFAEALQINTELGDQQGIAESLKFLAVVARDQNDPVTAKPLLEQSLALWRLTGDSHGVSGVLSNLGLIALLQNDVSQAKTLLAEGLAIARSTNNENRTATILALLGYCDLYEGLLHTAMTYMRESMQLALRFDYRGVVAFCLEGMGEIMGLYGETWEGKCCAARLLGVADALRKAIHSPLAPVYHLLYHRTLSQIRTQLDEDAFVQAWAEGQAMTLDEAVAYALTVTYHGKLEKTAC